MDWSCEDTGGKEGVGGGSVMRWVVEVGGGKREVILLVYAMLHVKYIIMIVYL